MKLRSLSTVCTALAVAIGTSITINQPSQAQNTTFFCGTSQGAPATIARTPRGNVAVIRWVSSFFNESGYSPQRRCEEVSSRFETYKNNGTLNYITTGMMNSQPVVCVSSSNGGSCSGLLFTLKRGQNASRTVQQLFNVRAGAAGPLNESSERVYIDVNEMLNQKPVESGGSATSEPAAAPMNPTQPGSQPSGSVW